MRPRISFNARSRFAMATAAAAQALADHMPTDRQRLALTGFFEIMAHWQADNGASRRILGTPPERTFYDWKKGTGSSRLPEDSLRRIGYVAGIWKALQIVYSDPSLADE